MSIFIASDCDGVFTQPGKYYYEEDGELKVFKRFSDRDSNAIQLLKEQGIELVIISGDNRINKKWCEHKKLPFEYCPPNKCKLSILEKKYPKQLSKPWVYIGDSMPDVECLNAATFAYYPQDVSLFLLSVLKKNAIRVPVKGGEGVLEWIALDLIKRELIPNGWGF